MTRILLKFYSLEIDSKKSYSFMWNFSRTFYDNRLEINCVHLGGHRYMGKGIKVELWELGGIGWNFGDGEIGVKSIYGNSWWIRYRITLSLSTLWGARMSTILCFRGSRMIEVGSLMFTALWHSGHFIVGFRPLNPLMYPARQISQKVCEH